MAAVLGATPSKCVRSTGLIQAGISLALRGARSAVTAPPAQRERGAPCKPRGAAEIVGTWPPSAVGCLGERPHPLLSLCYTLPEIIGGTISVLGARARRSLVGGQVGSLVTLGPQGTTCAEVPQVVSGPRAAKPSPKSYFFFFPIRTSS